MKTAFTFTLTLVALLLMKPLAAQVQQPDKSETGKKNALKLNIAPLVFAGVANILYERKITETVSLEAGYSYGKSNALKWWTSDDKLTAFTLEGKWYVEGQPLNGFYMGGYLKHLRTYDLGINRDRAQGYDRYFTQDETWIRTSAGATFGYQKVLGEAFVVNANFGLGYFFSQQFRGTVTDQRPVGYRTPERLDYRAGLSIGLAF